MTLDVSVIIPVHNEEENLPLLYPSLTRSLESLNKTYEVIMVDDGSADRSFEMLAKLQAADNRLKVIKFDRNYGQHPAISAGFEIAEGNTVIILDADMQNDPADISRFVEKIESGYDMVWGWRQNRYDTLITRKIPSYIFNKIICRATGVKLKDFNCGIKAFSKKVVHKVNGCGERRNFLPVFLATLSPSITEIPVKHRQRLHGESKYDFFKSCGILFSFLASYSIKPFRMVGILGIFSSLAGIFFSSIYIAAYYFLDVHVSQLATLLGLMVVVGVQFFIIGMIGELINRIYTIFHKQPLFVIEKVLGK